MKDVLTIVISTVLLLVVLALAGWLASVCVAVVFGIDFSFLQGVALVVLARLLFPPNNTNIDLTKGRE